MEKKNSRRNSNKKKRCDSIEQYNKSDKFLIYHDKNSVNQYMIVQNYLRY